MILHSVTTDLTRALRQTRRILRWMRRHPVRTFAIFVGIWTLISIAGGNVILAHAADGDIKSLPYLSALTAKDSGGIDMLHYVFLPIDRGDMFHPSQFMASQIIDPIWIFNIASISWGLWFIQFMVTMEWVDWITPPIQAVFDMLSSIVTSIGWVPLALTAAGLVGVLLIFKGRTGTGLTEILISAGAAALLVGILANPIGMLTGDDGAIRKTQQWSGSIAAAIASDNASLLNNPPSADNAKEVVSDTLLTQVMDAWIRVPAQEITFGHTLSGGCVDVYNKAMMQTTPGLPSSTNAVRDAVRGCDAAAGESASNPNAATMFTAAIATYGANILLLLAVALGILLLIATLFTIWSAGKWFFANVAAIAPGLARQAWFGSAFGVLAGLFVIGFSIVLVTADLKITTGVLTAMGKYGHLSTIAQLFFLDLMVTVLIGFLIYNYVKAKKAGEKMSERFARLGLGRRSRPQPVMKTLGQGAARLAGSYMKGKIFAGAAGAAIGGVKPEIVLGGTMGGFFGDSRPGPTPGMSAPGVGGGAMSELLPLLPLDGDGGNSPIKEKALQALGVGATVGISALTGGTGGAILALTKEAGTYVLQRGQATAGEPGSEGEQRIARFGRQIEVDAAGNSRVVPNSNIPRTHEDVGSPSWQRVQSAITAQQSVSEAKERLSRIRAGKAPFAGSRGAWERLPEEGRKAVAAKYAEQLHNAQGKLRDLSASTGDATTDSRVAAAIRSQAKISEHEFAMGNMHRDEAPRGMEGAWRTWTREDRSNQVEQTNKALQDELRKRQSAIFGAQRS